MENFYFKHSSILLLILIKHMDKATGNILDAHSIRRDIYEALINHELYDMYQFPF